MNTGGMNTFIDGQVFNTRQELIDWVQSVGRSLGYVIVIKRSKCNTNVLFQCNRGGTYKSASTVRKRGSIKVDCGFAVEDIYMSGENCWILKVLNLAHNHEPAEFLEGHAYVRRFSENELEVVKDLSVNNVKPRNILSTIKKQFPENVSTLKSIYNARQKFRLTEKDGKTQMQVLISFLHKEGYFFYTRASSSTTKLEDLFFAHPTSLAIWRAFPHVLLIDATYKTNRYGLPLVEIVGVSSTNMTFSIAFVFMDREKEPNYVWALECLKSTMDECMSPCVIVTDRELALINAYRLVFPDAKGLLCRWHIFRNITKHCRQSFTSAPHWYAFQTVWGQVIQSQTWELYVNNLARLQSILVDHHGVITYIDKTWLTPYKDMFVSVWTDQFLNFGNHTTNRAKSQHAKLKKYLESSQSDLVTALHCIHDVVQSQDTAIKASLEQSKILIQNQFNIPHFQQLLTFVSMHALELMLSEYKRLDTVGVFSEECGCRMRSSHGLPCAHEQAEYKSALQPVPLDAVDIFLEKA